MRTLKIAILALCATFLLAACGGGSPESVAKSYVRAYLDVDFKKAAKLATKEYGAEILDEAKDIPSNLLDELITARKKETKDVKYKVTNVHVDEEEAIVMFEFTKDGETEEGKVELIKEDGEWKVEYERIRF